MSLKKQRSAPFWNPKLLNQITSKLNITSTWDNFEMPISPAQRDSVYNIIHTSIARYCKPDCIKCLPITRANKQAGLSSFSIVFSLFIFWFLIQTEYLWFPCQLLAPKRYRLPFNNTQRVKEQAWKSTSAALQILHLHMAHFLFGQNKQPPKK